MASPSARPAVTRDPWLWALVGVLVLALPLLLHQGREQSFFLDEFDFIVDRSLRSPSTLFAPWYGHWVTLPAAVYRLLLSVFGLRTYLPYQLLSIAGHFAVVAMVWATSRRLGTRSWLATATVIPLVVLGSGRPNILFGFQITLTAALALGLAHLLLAVHDGPWSRRDLAGLLCGLAALMCSGVAVALAIGVGAAVLVLRGWKLACAHTVPLAATYLLWWALAPEGHSDPDPSFSADVLRFAVDMVKHALGGLGASRAAAVAIAALGALGAVVALAAIRARRDRAAIVLGLLVATGTLVLTTGVTRAEMHGLAGALEQRYVHLLVALLLPVVALGIERLAERSVWLTVPALAVLAVGIPDNVDALADGVPPNTIAPYARSEFLAAADPDRPLHPLIPIPVRLLQDAATNPSEWADVDISPQDQQLADLFLVFEQRDGTGSDDGCRVVTPRTVRTTPGEPIRITGDVGIVLTRRGVATGSVPFSAEYGDELVPSGAVDVTVEALAPGSGVLDC
jgi:hypothetical protein